MSSITLFEKLMTIKFISCDEHNFVEPPTAKLYYGNNEAYTDRYSLDELLVIKKSYDRYNLPVPNGKPQLELAINELTTLHNIWLRIVPDVEFIPAHM